MTGGRQVTTAQIGLYITVPGYWPRRVTGNDMVVMDKEYPEMGTRTLRATFIMEYETGGDYGNKRQFICSAVHESREKLITCRQFM